VFNLQFPSDISTSHYISSRLYLPTTWNWPRLKLLSTLAWSGASSRASHFSSRSSLPCQRSTVNIDDVLAIFLKFGSSIVPSQRLKWQQIPINEQLSISCYCRATFFIRLWFCISGASSKYSSSSRKVLTFSFARHLEWVQKNMTKFATVDGHTGC